MEMKLLSKYIATPGVMDKKDSRAIIVIFGFLRSKVNDRNKGDVYIGCIPIYWHSGKSPTVAKSSYAVAIQAAFYGFDTARFLKSLSGELLSGDDGVGAEMIVRNDNSTGVEHAHSTNSVTNGQRVNSSP